LFKVCVKIVISDHFCSERRMLFVFTVG